MDKHPANPDSESATNALYFHAANGDMPQVRRAVEQGAELNARHSDNRMSSLHKSLIRKNLDVVRYLLAQGADPNVATIRGFTPLHTVSTANEVENAAFLLDYGANPDAYSQAGTLDSLGETPLFSAGQRNSLAVLHQLLRAGADPLLPVFHNERVRDKIASTFDDVQAELEYYENLPRIGEVESVTKAELLTKDAQGNCPLDNPVTWRQWDAISAQLARNGERFTKHELHVVSSQGATYLAVAAEARSLDAVVRDLNRHGQALEVRELHGMAESLVHAHVPRAVFCESNMVLLGREGYRRNLDALPEAGRALLGNRFALSTAIARDENSHTPTRGR